MKKNSVLSLPLAFTLTVVFCSNLFAQSFDLQLDMANPKDWAIDVVHLGSKQIEITYNKKDDAVVMQPTWSKDDVNSNDVSVRNLDNGKLHLIQKVKQSDCTQSEVHFEISIPQEYIDEGKMEFVFSLQAGAAGDYLFNGHSYTMDKFAGSGNRYKKMLVVPADYNDDIAKLRKIERVNIIFDRNGSVVSAPIKIRKLGIVFNEDKILPPPKDIQVENPYSFYKFDYNTQKIIDALQVRVSEEEMDITRRLNKNGQGLDLVPQWKEGQIPEGHTGNVAIAQMLGAPHNFEPFEVNYVFNVPQEYLDENKIQFVPFVQAGEQGFYVWSGVSRNLSAFKGKGGKDVILTLSTKDFLVNKQKKKNLIEMVGFKIERHGSALTEPILLKSITVLLKEN